MEKFWEGVAEVSQWIISVDETMTKVDNRLAESHWRSVVLVLVVISFLRNKKGNWYPGPNSEEYKEVSY